MGEDVINPSEIPKARKNPVPSSSSGSSDEDVYAGDTEVEDDDQSKPIGIPLYKVLYGVRKIIGRQVGVGNN